MAVPREGRHGGLSGVYIRKRNQVVPVFSLGGAPQSQENAGAFTVRTPPKLSTPPSSIRSDGRTPSGSSDRVRLVSSGGKLGSDWRSAIWHKNRGVMDNWSSSVWSWSWSNCGLRLGCFVRGKLAPQGLANEGHYRLLSR